MPAAFVGPKGGHLLTNAGRADETLEGRRNSGPDILGGQVSMKSFFRVALGAVLVLSGLIGGAAAQGVVKAHVAIGR